MDGLPVAESAAALFGRIQLATPGAVNDAHGQFAAPHQRYADAAVLIPAGVIGRSVDRVDDPHGLMGRIGEILFLAQETAPGQQRRELLC